MTVSSVSTSTTTSTGNAQDVSSLFTGSVTLSLAEAVTSQVQPYLDRADSIATSINTNQTQIAAYQNMQSLLQALQSSVANLTEEATSGSNVFDGRVANLSSDSSTAASTILSASVSAGTQAGTHTVSVSQLATAEVDTSATQSVSSTTALGVAGTFSIGETGKTAATINVTTDMSLTDIAAAINGNSTNSGVSASVVSVSSTQSVIVLSGEDTDTQLNLSDTSGSVLQGLGILNSGTLTGTAVEATDTSALDLAGSFSVGGTTITVTTDMSLADIVSAINGAGNSALTASEKTGANGSQLTLSYSGGPITFSGVSGNVISGLGLAASGAATQVYAPQAAVFSIDGVAGITRSTNSVSDVLTGVTLDLTQADPNTTVTLQVTPDTTSATSAIQSFVTAYNSWVSFVTTNEATDSNGSAASTAILFGDSSLRDASTQVGDAVAAMVNNLTLADIGITLDSNNDLEVDSSTLASALSQSFSSVVSMFDAKVTTSSPLLSQFGSDYGSFAGSFSLGISTSNGTITGLTVNGASTSDFTFSGNVISGVDGGAYSGIVLDYSGNSDATVTVTGTQGIANQIYTTCDNFANSLTGSVENVIGGLQTEDTTMTANYNTDVTDANNLTTFLLNQYSQLTTQIQSAGETNYVLTQLMNAGNNSNG
jgi:flagellar hook-associated protein 2